MVKRCDWCGEDPLYIAYHDQEWGVPVYDDKKLFEMLTLEGAQAGLSWITILKKRKNYVRAFEGFDPRIIARYGDDDFARLVADSGIIRNKLKIGSTITNSKAMLAIVEEFGSFSEYLWRFVDGIPLQNRWHALADIPAQTDLSKKLSKDLKQRGFSFVGPTVCYSMMQAVGMVNDHLFECYRYPEIEKLSEPFIVNIALRQR